MRRRDLLVAVIAHTVAGLAIDQVEARLGIQTERLLVTGVDRVSRACGGDGSVALLHPRDVFAVKIGATGRRGAGGEQRQRGRGGQNVEMTVSIHNSLPGTM